jgi:hypothetical protein
MAGSRWPRIGNAMSDEKPNKNQVVGTGKPAGESAYRTLIPAGGKPASKPAATGTKPQPTSAPSTKPEEAKEKEEAHADPTRFGDWEVKGRCIDF